MKTKDLTKMSSHDLLMEYSKVCSRQGVRNSGLAIFLYEDPPDPPYYSEIIRRLDERDALLKK